MHQIKDIRGVSTRAEVTKALVHAGRALEQAGVEGAELALTGAAVREDPSVSALRAHFWASHRAADYNAARKIADQLAEIATEDDLAPKERERLSKILSHPVRQLAILNLVPPHPIEKLCPTEGRLAYILHNSLPHSSGGYATRSHGVARALMDAGWDVVAITRPGFPFDVAPDLARCEVGDQDRIDGIRYVRAFEPSRRGLGPVQYIELAAAALEQQLREQRPEVVVAASNHLTALPALIAAKRLGIPYFYEIRGLWEITRVSREPEFKNKITFWIQKELEAAVATLADGVFTLTESMKEEMERRGVPPAKITLLPNSCDATRFYPRKKDAELQQSLCIPDGVPVIGYVGTFVSYEGLDDLATACALLKQRNLPFRLLLVGNENASGTGGGTITEAIKRIAKRDGFEDWLIMPGRVTHESVPAYYSLIDIAAFPRKPLPVCEMVSPMKPLEALAMEKAVVASDVRALSEMVNDQETGLLFNKGDIFDLADKLALLIENAALRRRLGKNGRIWVREFRSWETIANTATEVIAPMRARTR